MNVRDWLHVEDHCRGIELVLKKGRVGDVYNIGGNCETTNLDLIERLCSGVDAAFAKDATLASRFPDSPAAKGQPTANLKSFVTDRLGHDRRYAIDATKISTELGYQPAHTLQQGFIETLDWYLHNEPWWTALLNRGR
jgi:dTDP-glucose 4,6-dehydratase